MSEFTIKETHKFGCLSISTWVSNDLKESLNIDENIWFLFSPPFTMSETWKKWLGTIKAEKFLENAFFIIITKASENISNANDENTALETKIRQIYNSLLLHGVARSAGNDYGFLLTGSNDGQEIDIKTYELLYPYYNITNARPKYIDKETITSALRLSEIIGDIYKTPATYVRFKRGFNKYFQGLREPLGGDKLHQFVRAVEAIIKPEIGRTKRQFIHRCQTFLDRSQITSDLLGEIFDLRSNIEHLNDFTDTLSNYDAKDRENIALRRAFQAELLAEHVYSRIIESPILLKFFENDDDIQSFWDKQDHERISLWGKQLDIEATANSQFRY